MSCTAIEPAPAAVVPASGQTAPTPPSYATHIPWWGWLLTGAALGYVIGRR